MRWFFTVLITTGLVVGAGYYFDLFPGTETTPETGQTQRNVKKPDKLGELLFPANDKQPKSTWRDFEGGARGAQSIVIEDIRINIYDKQEISATKVDGEILFIGEPIDRLMPGIETGKGLILTGDKDKEVLFRVWHKGAILKENQIVATINYGQALNEGESKKAKILVAQAELEAAEDTLKEAQKRFERAEKQLTVGKAIAQEEYGLARLTRDKSFKDERAKREAVKLAKIEADQATIILGLHEIRNRIPGNSIIKAIHKKRGEAVKPGEPIMELFSISRLNAEGFIDAQYRNELDRLKGKYRVILEPSQEQVPADTYKGHRGEITAVAVSHDSKNAKFPRFVSASDEGTVLVWRLGRTVPLAELPHPSPVTALACSPKGSSRNLCVTGCADGTVHIWDLDNLPKPGELANETVKATHADAVTAIAFSPDGHYFATAAQDISLWDATDGKVKYPFDADHGVGSPHQAAVTTLHFTRQSQLVSAARDNTLRVWTLRQQGAHPAFAPKTGRGGSVAKLGVSDDGRFMLLDKGKELQVLEVATGDYICSVQSNAPAFETMALLSSGPDENYNLLLTGGAEEGRLQLWKMPARPGERGIELRQLATKERSPTTCAAISAGYGSGETPFIVSGTRDGHVHVWALPSKQDIDNHQITINATSKKALELTLVERNIESGKVRIGVFVDNPESAEFPQGRLVPGSRATLIIEPLTKE